MDTKLYILSGPQNEKEHRVDKESVIVGRQDKEKNWYPDIDLYPDKKVSRKHLKIWQQQGGYWIKDLQSKHGTLVDNEEISEKESGVPLNISSRIHIGETILRIEPPDYLHLENRGIRIGFQILETFNFALAWCGFPVISDLEISNNSSSDSEPQDISFLLNGYSTGKKVKCPFLKSGQSSVFGDVAVEFDLLRLEGQIGKTVTELLVKIKDEVVLRKNISVLAYNEFSLCLRPEHQVSLASFVQPLHPIVSRMVGDNKLNLEGPSHFKDIVKASYEYLEKRILLDYQAELSYSPELGIQKIRLPHQIFGDDIHPMQGEGTCIDLSVYFAAYLENTGLRPLIFLIRNEGHLHTFSGCWQPGADENIRPLIFDKKELLDMAVSGKIILVECTGFTRGKEHLSFDLAVEKALATLRGCELLYALDIYAARRYGGIEGIKPLPFVGTPRYSDEMDKVLDKAGEFASAGSSKVLGIPHLILGLLDLEGGIMQQVFLEQKIDIQSARKKITKGLQVNAQSGFQPRPSYHYEEAINMAVVIAKRKKSVFVEVPHLVEALLEVRSDSLEGALAALSTTPRRCLGILYRLTGLASSFSSSKSLFRDE